MLVGEAAIRPEMNADAEIVALFSRPECDKPLDFPMKDSLSLYGTNFNNEAILCGVSTNQTACFGYDVLNLTWHIKPFALNEERMHASGTVFGNGSWIITGGQQYIEGSPIILDTSEILEKDHFRVGPKMPLVLSGHCVVSMMEELIISTGGYGQPTYLRDSFLMYVKEESFQYLPKMKHGRYGHSCGRIVTQFDEMNIIIVGGLRQSTVEIYLPKNKLWVYGPHLEERGVFKAAHIQGSRMFVISGGVELEPNCKSENCRLTDIFSIDPNQNKWSRSTNFMKNGRGNHATISLPTDIDCTSNIF